MLRWINCFWKLDTLAYYGLVVEHSRLSAQGKLVLNIPYPS